MHCGGAKIGYIVIRVITTVLNICSSWVEIHVRLIERGFNWMYADELLGQFQVVESHNLNVLICKQIVG